MSGEDLARGHTIIIAESVRSLCGRPILTGCWDGLGRRAAEFIPNLYQTVSETFISKLG